MNLKNQPRKVKRTVIRNLSELIAKQLKWIEEHGATLAGYVARYGSQDDPEHYDDGGEAIYAADKAELERLQAAS